MRNFFPNKHVKRQVPTHFALICIAKNVLGLLDLVKLIRLIRLDAARLWLRSARVLMALMMLNCYDGQVVDLTCFLFLIFVE